jgi:hypothetical protein
MFVRQSCPVIHKTSYSYCYLQIKSAEQNRLWCLPQTLYKECIYWYTSQSISAHALCLYAHISKSLSFWLYHVVTLHWDDVFALTLLKNILYAGNFMRRCNNFSCGPGWHSWYTIKLVGLNPTGTKVYCFMYVCVYIYIYIYPPEGVPTLT